MSDLMMDYLTNPNTNTNPNHPAQDNRDKYELDFAFQMARNMTDRLSRAAYHIHRLNRRFYHDINTGVPINRNPGEMIALMHSELSEMLEGVRKNSMDSHIPSRRAEEVELADLFIRALDFAAYRNLDVAGAIADKLRYNLTRKDHTDEERRKANGKKF